MNQERKQIILTAWTERGREAWDPETHGRGLLSLNIPAEVGMTPRGPLGTPIPPYNLEFRLEHTTVNGQVINAIVCEGIVVEPTGAWEEPSKKPFRPAPYRSRIGEARKRRRR
jgi:hypothetical protein